MFMRLLFFMPSLRAGVFLPEHWKISFQLSGSDAFCQKYIIFCRAKRYSVAPLLTNLSTPAKQKEQASACSFCFTCEAVKERFELRATPPGGKTVLWTVFSDDRRYLQSIGLNFRICFANIKRKISPPQPRGNNTNYEGNSRFVLFFTQEYFGVIVRRIPRF